MSHPMMPSNKNMQKIKSLLDNGYYMQAASLADKNKITDCRSIIKNLEEIKDISNSIEDSISSVTTLETKIHKYDSELRNISDTIRNVLYQVEGEERAVQVKNKNLTDTCDLIKELLHNLNLPQSVQHILEYESLHDGPSIGRIEAALSKLELALQYIPEPTLQKMRCVREQKNRANEIKTAFLDRFLEYLTQYFTGLMRNFSESFFENIISQTIIMPGYLLHIVEWIMANDYPTYRKLEDLSIEVENKYREMTSHFMEQQLMTIREFKAPKTSKCGVVSIVKNFERFITQVESLSGSTDARRTDIDRWYQELGSELFSTIDRLEHSKTPQEMIRIENYNYLNDVLSRYRSMKVKCLEDLRKRADLQYREARNAYVARYFGRPLEKLNQFFEGVEARLALGVKEEEISFQLAFSKQELRKVLQSVTLKEVRKGLEEMYRRIEKHAYEPDSNLIQAIWRDMQDEFLSQYKQKQNMIERCYPSSNLSLTFTIDDVIDVFKHIAQSH